MSGIQNLDSNTLINAFLKKRLGGASIVEPEVLQALMFMTDNLDDELTVREIAERQHVSRRTLELWFRKHLRCTVCKALTKLRVLAAVQLLQNTQLPISEISYTVGFSSLSRLSHAVKQILGVTATQLRRNSLEQPDAGS